MKRLRIAVLIAIAGCAPQKKNSGGTVTLALSRGTGSDVDVVAHVVDASGAPLPGAPPALTIAGGHASAPVDAGGGDYTATVTPDALDSVVTITASSGGAKATETALVFANLDPSLGQPQALDGLVNTGGWEDGENVSPDGQWLIVATYVPLDALSCSIGGTVPSAPACMAITGPYAAPERPGMLGAARIHDGTYDNDCPSFGITTPQTSIAFMPVAAYGFHRQADGSFAEPFVIGYEADGCLGPYGFSFTGTPSGTSAGTVFANHDPLAGGSATDADVYYAPLTLGQPNILGSYSVQGGGVVETGDVTTHLPPMLPTRQGNPSYGGGRLWWDDEDESGGARDLYFADVTGTLPAVTAGSAMTVGVSTAGAAEIQPSIDGSDLYWTCDAGICRATLTAGADPSLPASWTPTQSLLGPAAVNAAEIVAIGEPTVAHVPGGGNELYFVYVVKRGSGYDANVARVPLN